MNINDFKTNEYPENIWKAIFEKQMELAVKYKDIEKMGTLLETINKNVDTAEGQKWIKDFMWRVTEELCEAKEALDFSNLEDDEETADIHYQHYLEELIDALHFMTELCIIAGYSHEEIDMNLVPTNSNAEETIYYLGLAANCLKNKPWKQTQMLTDRPKFFSYLGNSYHTLIRVLLDSMEEKEIYDFYFRKNKVNQFRIRSKY